MTSSLPRGDVLLALLGKVIVGLVNICGLREVTGDRWEFRCSSVFSIPFSRRGPDHRVDGCSLRWLRTKRRQNAFTPARESASCKLYYGPQNGCR